MKTTIKHKHFFAYSPDSNKMFYTEFGDHVNIIYGRNTSGKSTLIQAINYTFGINDEKHKLQEIFESEPNIVFRLDFELSRKSQERITIIRENEFIYIKRENSHVLKFSGVSTNHSQEHIELKEYISNLLGFTLFLESSSGYNLGSIESMFLPYYVAQDYGWVLALKSFRSFEFFSNFKIDYYDYYLGIINKYNREKKKELENQKKEYESEINILRKVENSNEELQLSKLMDESFTEKTTEYLEYYKTKKEKLIRLEKEYIGLSNKLKYLQERLNVLRQVRRETLKQNPLKNNCPTCRHPLPNSTEHIYNYYQGFNDTEEELKNVKGKIKDNKGEFNSRKKEIETLREDVQRRYKVLGKYKIDSVDLETWLKNKITIQSYENVQDRIDDLEKKLETTNNCLKEFKTEVEILEERNGKSRKFTTLFRDNLLNLEVKLLEDLNLYRMGLFPKQGVELLKTLMAYYFAFNKLISNTDYVHRLPFVMDAVFKEDIDDNNKKLILGFISKEKPIDTQIIFSISESRDNKTTAEEYNENFFNNEAYLILINKEHKRSFLRNYEEKYKEILDETEMLMK